MLVIGLALLAAGFLSKYFFFELDALVALLVGLVLMFRDVRRNSWRDLAVDWARANYAQLLGQDGSRFANGSTSYHLQPGSDSRVVASVSGLSEFQVTGSVNVKVSDSVDLAPPGLELASLLEDELGEVEQKSVDDLLNLLPRVMSEELALADSVSFTRSGQVITMTIEKSAFLPLFSPETRLAAERLGCPMTSAVAILLVRESREEVMMTCNYSDQTGTISSKFELSKPDSTTGKTNA